LRRGSRGRKTDAVIDDGPHSARVWNYWLGGTDNVPTARRWEAEGELA
jgi:hypothetical protein